MKLGWHEETKETSVVQIWKLVVDTGPEDRGGNIWGDSDESSCEEVGELEERNVRPLIKAKSRRVCKAGTPDPWSAGLLLGISAQEIAKGVFV